jgi:hybrid cluster-associated redox disulfide protein
MTKEKIEKQTIKEKIGKRTKKDELKKRRIKKEKEDLITKETTFIELLEKKPNSFELLFQAGLHCLGCSMSAYETIEQGCLAHGMSKKEIENLIKKINKSK